MTRNIHNQTQTEQSAIEKEALTPTDADPSDKVPVLTGAQYLVNTLLSKGVKTVFGYPGGAIMPLYDALYQSGIQHVLCRHEQAAALAADGFARASGQLGVCLATSGPGATNLVTGLANAFMDSVPLLAITGQVAQPLIGTDAFQEIDILGMTLSVVKHSYLLESVEQLPQVLEDAIFIATDGRPGPVLIDIPKNLQQAEFVPSGVTARVSTTREIDLAAIGEAVQRIQKAQRPLFYVGGGVPSSGAEAMLRQLLEKLQIPAVTTLKAVGCCGDYSLSLGMLGMHGLKAANYAVQNCDLLIALGARFDDRATGKLDQFARQAQIIQFDIDPAEMNKLKIAHVVVEGDLKDALPLVTEQLSSESLEISDWRLQCKHWQRIYQWKYKVLGNGIYAPRFLRCFSQRLPSSAIVTCDVGQHQMWVAQHCYFDSASRHLSSGGLGTMGYGLPAAIGAQLAEPESLVVNVCGDGSFAMNLQELMTLNRYQLPVKIVLIDNQSLGMVRQWQSLFFQQRFSEIDLSDNPDFVVVAKSFGLDAKRITQRYQESEGIEWLLAQPGPCLLQVCISNRENVWPLVPPGASNSHMLEGDQHES
jgi:acetolactate synthase-1/2/3 large subunit